MRLFLRSLLQLLRFVPDAVIIVLTIFAIWAGLLCVLFSFDW